MTMLTSDSTLNSDLRQMPKDIEKILLL